MIRHQSTQSTPHARTHTLCVMKLRTSNPNTTSETLIPCAQRQQEVFHLCRDREKEEENKTLTRTGLGNKTAQSITSSSIAERSSLASWVTEELSTRSRKLTAARTEAGDGLIAERERRGGCWECAKSGSHVSSCGFSQALFFFCLVASSFLSFSPFFLPLSLLWPWIRV